ncbi:MAG: nitrite/sulfite reductase [Sulfurimonas sp.]|nr:nitrite/sulfite reductase [Sulfurimonas sp.]
MQNNDLSPKLNKREKYKARLRPYDYFSELENLDFENLGEGDRFYLQDFGIFTTDFLEDEFTMRVRVPAGRLSAEQFSYIAQVVDEYELTIIITARAGLQLHKLEAGNVLEIWKKLNAHRLTTWQSFGDNIRNIVSNVYDGRGKYSEIETYPIIMQMQDYIVKNPRYVGMLPRRVSIGVSGNRASITSFFANDLYFALALKDGIYGFNVYMGGKNTEIAKDADIFLLKEEVLDFFKAFVEAFYLHGSRSSRSKTRLFYMIESIGLDALKLHIEKEYGKAFQSGGKIQLEKVVFSQHEKLKDGTFAYCYQTDFARLDAKEMKQISSFALEHKVDIRLGIDQNIYLLGLKDTITPFDSPKKSATIITCAGSLCPYSFWSIKNETKYLPLDKISQHSITVGFSGCIKGCGRHRHTDIGLVGLKTNNFGDTEGGARVFVGAVHTDGLSISRMLFSMVPLVHLHKTLELIIELYELSGYKNFEEFSDTVLNRYSEGFLALWVLANLQTKQAIKLDPVDSGFEYEKSLLKENFSEVDFIEPIEESFAPAVSALSKKMWTVAGVDPIYKPKLNRVNFR